MLITPLSWAFGIRAGRALTILHLGIKRSCEPRKQAGHLAAPTDAATVKLLLASRPHMAQSGHRFATLRGRASRSANVRFAGLDHLLDGKTVAKTKSHQKV
jgi:hypothetical protein